MEQYKEIIAEELNVKEVEYIQNVEDIAIVDYKVNLSTVGKTMGSKITVITKEIKTKTIITYFKTKCKNNIINLTIYLSYFVKK